MAEWSDDKCIDPIGTGTDHLIIPDLTLRFCPDNDNDLYTVIVRYTCPSTSASTVITIQQDQSTYYNLFRIHCRPQPGGITRDGEPDHG